MNTPKNVSKDAGIPPRIGGELHASGTPCLVVGIGASAGGQGALEQFFTAMPHDCGIAFVVIMHIPPAGPSFLADMLGRFTTMTVTTAEEGMPLLPDRVFVIPAGREMLVRKGRLILKEPEPRHVLHPIDSFFRSLASEQQGGAVAVILSGSGIDGTAGAKQIRDAGGTVIVQEPGTALYPDMPRSTIAAGAASAIMPAEEIAGKIVELADSLCTIASGNCRVTTFDEELQSIFDIVKAATGHDFSSYKRNTIIRRIERRMAVNEVAGMKKYISLLENSEQEPMALAQDILIGVTSFFRDREAFEIIRTEVVPRLFAGRNPDVPVRIWHACCATGEEVYSMAFLIREYLDSRQLDARVQIFATDIDETSITQARAGLYPEEIETEVGEERLKSFFIRSDKRWQVVKQVREMIVFAHHSVIKNPPFSRLDLLVCRNFLIYMNPDMQKRLISLFSQVLKPGGVLFLGASETVGRTAEQFTPLDKKWKIFERTEERSRADSLFPIYTPSRYLPGTGRPLRKAEAMEMGPGAVAERILMHRYSPPCLVVNERYEVVHISTRANGYLEVPVGEPTRDILKMAREELRPVLRAAIHKAFAENAPVDFRGVQIATGDRPTSVNLLVEPLETGHSTEKLAMVVFAPASNLQPMIEAVGAAGDISGDKSTREMLIRQLEEQLRITHEQLQATIEQLDTSNEGFLSANEELISMNEEFQSANEELQSTNEELETSKEELQALNEELVTLNAELQEKVGELDEVNSDMENLLTSSGIATLFLDCELTIKRFTPAMAGIFNLIPADIGRPFRHLAGTIDWPEFPHEAHSVIDNLAPAEREVTAIGDGRHFLLRLLPYRTMEGRIDGIVVTLIDISEHKRTEEHIRHLASFPQLNPNPVLETDLYGNLVFANPATERIMQALGLKQEEIAVFLPTDLQEMAQAWDKKSDATVYREVVVGERVFGETIFLAPQLGIVRIYAYDITERVLMERALRESEERLRLFIEHAPAALAMFDTGMRYLCVSRRWLSDYGLTGRNLLGESHYDIFPEISAQWREAHRRGLAGEIMRGEADRFERADGSVQWVRWEIRPWNDAAHNIGGIVIFAEDITDLKEAEEYLRRYRLLADNSRDIILFLRRDDGRILEANAAAATAYGYDHGELLGLTVGDLRAPETAGLTTAQMAKSDAGGILFETIHRRRDGSTFPVEVSSQGATIGGERTLISVIRDITERRQVERALQESEERVRRKLDSILTPEGDMGGLDLADIIDTQSLQSLAGNFYELTRMPMGLLDLKGNILVGVGWQDICTKFHRLNPETCANCVESDVQLSAGIPHGKYKIYKCRNNMWDVATPIFVGDRHFGNLFMGQFFFDDEPLDCELFRAQAKQYGFDEDDYIACLKAAPRLTRETLDTSMAFFMELAGVLSKLGYSNLKLARSLAERDALTSSLQQSSARLDLQAEIASRLLVSDAPQRIVNELCQKVMTFLDCHVFFNFLMDEKTNRLQLNACAGISDEEEKKIEWLDFGVAICGCSARDACRIVAEDIPNTADPRTDLVKAYGIRAYACHPLMAHGQVLGTLSFGTRTRASFSDDDLALMKAVADQVAIAMERKRTEKALRSTRDELEIKVRERTGELTRTVETLREEIIERARAETALHAETEERLRTMEELREKDTLLLQQSRLAAMGEMINNIAHQWRQPLNLLGMNIQKMLLFYDLGEFDRELLASGTDDAMALIRHMSQTIDDFRTFFRSDKEKTEFGMLQAVQKTLSLIQDGLKNDRIDVDLRLDPEATINGYQNEFCQVVLNIILNARDALIERRISPGRISLASTSIQNRIIITIVDNAGGIPEEIIDRIFEPYFSTKGVQGSGIGLYMSKQIIETNMGGALTARNTALGAEFRIEL